MSNAVNGLLTQKPDSPYGEPSIGDVRNFSVVPTPKRDKPGETWNKLKNDKDGYGQQFKVLKADRLDDYNHPQHGTFHQFSLLLEPQAAPAASNGNGGEYTPETQARVNRHVAAKIAGRILAYEVGISLKASDKPIDPQVLATRLAVITDAFIPVLQGAADPKEKVAVSGPWMEAESAGAEAQTVPAASDDDIPW